MWREENIDEDTELSSSAELRSVGITASGIGGDVSNLTGATEPPPDASAEEPAAQPGQPAPPA
jgi:hypothetical protein